MEQLVLEGARLLFSQGGAGWIVAVLLGAAYWLRDRQYGACLLAQIELAKSIATTLERSAATNAAVAAALESRTGVFERLNERVGSLEQAVEQEMRAVSERVGTNGRAIEDVSKGLNELRIAQAGERRAG